MHARLTDLVVRGDHHDDEFAFWGAGLGLRHIARTEVTWAQVSFFDTGGHLLELHIAGLRQPVPSAIDDCAATVAFWTDDLSIWLPRVLEHGGTLIGQPVESGGTSPARYAAVASPSGQPIMLIEGDVPAYRQQRGMPPLADIPGEGLRFHELIWRIAADGLEAETRLLSDGLGLRRLPRADDLPGHVAHWDLGGPLLEVIAKGPGPTAPAERTKAPLALNMQVDDVPSALQRLEDAGGRPLMEVSAEGSSHFVYVATPAGHVVDLVQGDVQAYRRRLGAPPLPDLVPHE